MARYILLGLIVFLCFPIIIFSQEQEEDLPEPPKRFGQERIGGAGGFMPFWLFLDTDQLNKILENNLSAPLKTDGMILYGGGGYAYIMIVNNVRVGGLGAGGEMKSSAIVKNTNIRRDVEFSVGFGGVTVDYVIPVINRLDIALGILLGGGSMDITITRDYGTNKIWSDIWSEYGGNANAAEFTRKFSSSFFCYQPSLNLEYSILRWLAVRIGIGYNGMTRASWKLDEKFDVFNVPDNINAKGFMINGGIFLGTFMY